MAVSLDEFAAAGQLPNTRCWFQRLNDEQREKVTAAYGAGYSQRTIAKVVSDWGVSVRRTQVGEHLRGACSCQS